MSLPQTVWGVPFGEQRRVIVSPSLPFSEVAFASQVVGFPPPLDEGGIADGPEPAVSG